MEPRAGQHLDRHRQPAPGPVPRSVRGGFPAAAAPGRGHGARLRRRARVARPANVVDFHVVGREFGPSKVAKVTGVLRRARALASLLGRAPRPDALLCASRSAALAARRCGIPSFVIGDYEFANSSVYRLTRSTILYPDVVDPAPLLASGVRRERLIPFRGLKEDISLGRRGGGRRRSAPLRRNRRRARAGALPASRRAQSLLRPEVPEPGPPGARALGGAANGGRRLRAAPPLAGGRPRSIHLVQRAGRARPPRPVRGSS